MTQIQPPESEDSQLSAADMARIVAETFVEHVDYHREIDSTNNRALSLARGESSIAPVTLIYTEQQTAGRGRGQNRWWSVEGALTFSLLLDCNALNLPPSLWPMASLTTGLAVCAAIEGQLTTARAQLKWPNDVYLQGCKVCGILVEGPDSSRGRIVIGIGINVNNPAAHAPLELRGFAISLSDVAQRKLAPLEVLIGILQQLAGGLKELAAGDQDLRAEWQTRCLLTGCTVVLDQDTRQITGLCHGIDHDGALVLETDLGIQRCLSGTITHFGSGPAN